MTALNIRHKIFYSVLLILAAHLSTAQSTFRHSLSFSGGMSLPVGKFANDSQGEGHGFANPGFIYHLGYNVGPEESRLNFLAGLSAILNPLDEKEILAMYPEGVTIESKNYHLFGLSGGVAYYLLKSEGIAWQVKAAIGGAIIHYPAHELRYIRNNGSSALVSKTNGDKSINLTGTIGSVVKFRVSPSVHLGGGIDFFRSRSNHEVTFITGNLLPDFQNIKQEIAIINTQVAVYYTL